MQHFASQSWSQTTVGCNRSVGEKPSKSCTRIKINTGRGKHWKHKQTSSISRILADLVKFTLEASKTNIAHPYTLNQPIPLSKSTESATRLRTQCFILIPFHRSISHPNLAKTPCDRLISSDQTLAWAILVDTWIDSIRHWASVEPIDWTAPIASLSCLSCRSDGWSISSACKVQISCRYIIVYHHQWQGCEQRLHALKGFSKLYIILNLFWKGMPCKGIGGSFEVPNLAVELFSVNEVKEKKEKKKTVFETLNDPTKYRLVSKLGLVEKLREFLAWKLLEKSKGGTISTTARPGPIGDRKDYAKEL